MPQYDTIESDGIGFVLSIGKGSCRFPFKVIAKKGPLNGIECVELDDEAREETVSVTVTKQFMKFSSTLSAHGFINHELTRLLSARIKTIVTKTSRVRLDTSAVFSVSGGPSIFRIGMTVRFDFLGSRP